MKRITFILVLLLCLADAAMAQKGYRKLVSVLGDSYSTFRGYTLPDTNAIWYEPVPANRNDVTKVEQLWWHQLITNKGYRLEVNNSYSGSTICNTGYRKEDYTHESFVTRMKYLGSPDIILICGGTNDSWARSPIGEYKYEGWTKEDLYSFRPAMAWMLEFITKRYINAEVYFILNSELSEDINNSVHTICQHYAVPCIDLHDIDKQRSHPSIAGMKAMAEQVGKAMKK